MSRATRHLVIRGRVRGVGYRDAMCRAAAALGVAGWVRNRADGSVEAMVQGDDKGLREIIAWARNGPPAARVVDVQVGEATGDFAAFECRPTA